MTGPLLLGLATAAFLGKKGLISLKKIYFLPHWTFVTNYRNLGWVVLVLKSIATNLEN